MHRLHKTPTCLCSCLPQLPFVSAINHVILCIAQQHTHINTTTLHMALVSYTAMQVYFWQPHAHCHYPYSVACSPPSLFNAFKQPVWNAVKHVVDCADGHIFKLLIHSCLKLPASCATLFLNPTPHICPHIFYDVEIRAVCWPLFQQLHLAILLAVPLLLYYIICNFVCLVTILHELPGLAFEQFAALLQ